ncbi:hypothetical protein MMC11_003121 [Xylographa trunciseda]|nr:hypothetical protein [Xylographa trunciseda]
MGRPRKQRRLPSAVPQPGQQVPATTGPLPAFDFSDLAFDASLPNTEYDALGLPEFHPPSLGSWGGLSEDSAMPSWDPYLMLASPSGMTGTAAVPTSAEPSPASLPLPVFSPLSSIPPATCACLPTMYLTLSTLQSLQPSFPLALPPLRAATDAVRRMLDCATCSRPPLLPAPTHAPLFTLPTALPNTMLLATLIPHITHRYAQLLAAIDHEAASGARKTFRIGETENPLLEDQHTGRHGCAVAVDVEMEAQEWRAMMRGVVRRDLLGEGGLAGLVERMGERQKAWHEVGARMNCGTGWKKWAGEGEPMCLRVVEATRSAVQMVDVT